MGQGSAWGVDSRMTIPSSHPPHRLGRRGEELAARLLVDRGWTILARNYRAGRREVDLVIGRPGVVVFVEVKARAGSGFGTPEAAVTLLKRREIETVAADYLLRHGDRGSEVRFDVVAVTIEPESGAARLEHIEDAWRPGWA